MNGTINSYYVKLALYMGSGNLRDWQVRALPLI